MSEKKDKNKSKYNKFESVLLDPKFKPIPKKVKKIEIDDERFNEMFTNKDFSSGIDIDEYGRKNVNKPFKNTIEEFYTKTNNKSNKSNKSNKKEKEKKKKKIIKEEDKANNEIEEELSSLNKEDTKDKLKKNKKEIKQDNEDESESDTSEEFKEFLETVQNENKKDLLDDKKEMENIPTGEETKRFAVQNIDWTNIHALDLYILFNSFCKGNQKVEKVEIYPSEFGMKEMEKENKYGPDKEIFNTENENKKVKSSKNKTKKDKDNKNIEEDNEEKDEDEESYRSRNSEEGFDPIELRKYELKKLKYYYAIVYCDSIETASHLYTECDGQEIERTQSFMDLRFVPDSLTKFPYPPKEVCNSLPLNKEYMPNFKPNSALQDTKVKLTWDETDPRRSELIERAFHKEGFNEDDIKELLVSSDEEDEDEDLKEAFDDNENNEDKEKESEKDELNLLKKKRKLPKFKDGETIVINFNKGFEGLNPNVTDDTANEKENKSKWEKFKEEKKNKRREIKQQEKMKKLKVKEERNKYNEKNTKNELELLVQNDKIKKENKFNANDNRFDTKNNTDFAIDPTNKNYKKYKNFKNN